MKRFLSTKIIELGSCAFRQPNAKSHCSKLHGYRLTAKFWFSATVLDSNNWVVDFGGLKTLKGALQQQFDHTTCISESDPAIDLFRELHQREVIDLRIMPGVGVEKFAEFCLDMANKYVTGITSGRCTCVKVEVFEHGDNSAICESIPDGNTPENVNVTITATHDPVNCVSNTPIPSVPVTPETLPPDPQSVLPPNIIPSGINRAAPVGNKTTPGFSNPFKGTSWGS